MALNSEDIYGVESPGGFVFGVQGFHWGDPKPRSITFFLDNTAKVCDQHGRPIKGAMIDNKEVRFATCPPSPDDLIGSRSKCATHAEVIAALLAEGIDWQKLSWAGWPQISYDQLKQLPQLPPTPLEELRKIKDQSLRRDALRVWRETEAIRNAEMQLIEEE